MPCYVTLIFVVSDGQKQNLTEKKTLLLHQLTSYVSNHYKNIVTVCLRQINNDERDGGVLLGNWSGKYDDGVAPFAWNGSAAILEEFLKKRKGVKYGQCWTFAAVATTCKLVGCITIL